MNTNAQVRDAIFRALDELNAQLPPDRRLSKDEATPLAGPDGHLDSLGVVNLIALIEQIIEQRFGTTVNLIDSGLLSEGESLNSVGALLTFVLSVLEESSHV